MRSQLIRINAEFYSACINANKSLTHLSFMEFPNLGNRTIVEALIRHDVLRRRIWVSIVWLGPTERTLGLNGLNWR